VRDFERLGESVQENHSHLFREVQLLGQFGDVAVDRDQVHLQVHALPLFQHFLLAFLFLVLVRNNKHVLVQVLLGVAQNSWSLRNYHFTLKQ